MEGAAPAPAPPLHNSLPRKVGANFRRNAPGRRSALSAAGEPPLVEYFIPRSVSEFDLSVAASGDAPVEGLLPLTVRAPRRAGREKTVTFEDELRKQGLRDVFM